MGAAAVVVKGGHLEGSAASTDLFYDGHGFREYPARRIETKNTHGTGCTFASAIAAGLAKGLDVPGAVALAKSYVTLAIQHAYPVGAGHGPVHHFYRFWQPTGPRYRLGRTGGVDRRLATERARGVSHGRGTANSKQQTANSRG